MSYSIDIRPGPVIKRLTSMAINNDSNSYPPTNPSGSFTRTIAPTMSIIKSIAEILVTTPRIRNIPPITSNRPRYFIIDEVDKMNKKDQTSLLNLMESGILSELKHNQRRTTQLKTWVFASGNTTDKLLQPLLSRFTVIHFKPYTEDEFREIVVNVLDREGVDKGIALIIADGVFNTLKSSNIRECVRIARLARNDTAQVDRIIDTFAKYGKQIW
jgi:MoxR-like ATPase